MDFYQHARYYEIAFDFRDVPAELDFLLGCYQQFSGQQAPATTLLELACGPGQHAREAAKRGLTTTGLDLSEEMIAYARQRPYGDRVNWLVGDMRAFTLDAPINIACTLIDSVVHILSLDDFLAHLAAVAASLTPGGIYVIEQSHPREAFADLESYTETDWTVEARGARVTISWGDEDDPFDPITLRGTTTVRMHITEKGKSWQIESKLPQKTWLPTEMEAAYRANGSLELVQRYGALDFNIPFNNSPRALKMVTVLRKRATT
jgi:SAM-dependent methyltransferase